MTEDNCADYDYMGTPVEEPTLQTKLASLINFLRTMIDFIVKLFKGEVSLGK